MSYWKKRNSISRFAMSAISGAIGGRAGISPTIHFSSEGPQQAPRKVLRPIPAPCSVGQSGTNTSERILSQT